MTVDTATFLSQFSEFANQPAATVAASLQQADIETDEVVWGSLHDCATYWLAAHLLAIRIREVGMFTGATSAKQFFTNQQSGVHGGYGSTLYGQEFMRLEQNRVPPTIGFVV